MIIGLVGYAQSGKDTVADILINKHGFVRKAFADKIKEFVYEFDDPRLKIMIDHQGWNYAKKIPHVRNLLQSVGVAARNVFGEDFWVDMTMKEVDKYSKYVFTDVRFKNEALTIKLMGGEIWRIERPGIGPVNNHISELELKDYEADRVLVNGGSLDELGLLVQTRIGSLLNAN